jgi:peptide/nickel transport system ATP-binding protein
MGLHKESRAHVSGEILVDGIDVVASSENEVRELRGKSMAMIFQDALAALHPYYTVGNQIAEAYRVHNNVSKKAAETRAIEMLDLVGIPDPAKRAESYPHQFSGGMRQRAMIAMALSCNPSLLIADEPTTALDVTVQAQILDLLRDLQKEFGSAIILITHDLGVVAEIADDILLMYAGREIEGGSTRDLLKSPQHPYAWGLLSSIPRLTGDPTISLPFIEGTPPSLINPPTGCSFNPRCKYVDRVGGACSVQMPDLIEIPGSSGHAVRCHLDHNNRVSIFDSEVRPFL